MSCPLPLRVQDGNDEGVASLAASLGPTFLRSAGGFEFWQKHPRVPALGANQPGHAYLAQHYGWGLGRVFDEREHSHAVIVEDDMLFSPGGWVALVVLLVVPLVVGVVAVRLMVVVVVAVVVVAVLLPLLLLLPPSTAAVAALYARCRTPCPPPFLPHHPSPPPPDFLLYFEATAPLLDADPTLWCISSWNDNGFQKGHNWDVRRLFRTSYFPGQ